MPGTKHSEKISQILNADIVNNISLSRGKVKIILDMFTQLEDVNQKLLESEKVKSQFLSNIRNEINNPLASIVGLTDNIIRNTTMSPENIKDAITTINKEVLNLDFQLSNIFLAAELEAGESQLEITKFNIVDFISDAFNKIVSFYPDKKITFNIENIGEIDTFKTDAFKFEQVLKNLFENSIKFNDTNCDIIVKFQVEDKKLIIKIIDNGIGIHSDDTKNIFSRFTQLISGSHKNYSGHGLGLAIVKNIIELMNGEIEVESEVDKGTTVVITIPESEGETDDFLFGDDDFFFGDDSEENNDGTEY